MAIIDCINEIENLTDEQKAEVIEDLNLKGENAPLNVDIPERLTKSMQDISEANEQLSVRYKKDIEAYLKRTAELDKVGTKEMLRTMVDWFQVNEKFSFNSGNAIDAQQRGLAKSYNSSFHNGLDTVIKAYPEEAKSLGVKTYSDIYLVFDKGAGIPGFKKYNAEAYKVLYNEKKRLSYETPQKAPKNTNPFITELAKQIIKTEDFINHQKRKYGWGKKFLQGYVSSRNWNDGHVLLFGKNYGKDLFDLAKKPFEFRENYKMAAKEDFTQYMLGELDTQRMQKYQGRDLTNAELKEMVDGVADRALSSKDLAFISDGNLSKGLNKEKHRVLFFKDDFALDEKMGFNIINGITRDVEYLAHQMPLWDRFGAHVHRNLKELVRHQKAQQNGYLSNKDRKLAITLDNAAAIATGENRLIADRTLDNVSKGLEFAAVMAYMPQFIVSALFLDPITMRMEFFRNGLDKLLADSVAVKFATLPKNIKRDINRALRIVNANDKKSGGAVRHINADSTTSSNFLNKAKHVSGMVSGLSPATDIASNTVIRALSANLAQNKGKSFAKLDYKLKPVLQSYGIDSKMWNLIRKKSSRYDKDLEFITPSDVDSLSLDDVRKVYGKSLTDTEADDIKVEAFNNLNTYYVARSEYGVIRPDAKTTAFTQRAWLQGNRVQTPGTLGHTLAQSMSALISHPHAYSQKIIRGVLLNYNMKDRAKLIAFAAVSAYVGGYLVTIAKEAGSVASGRQDEFSGFWERPFHYITIGGFFGIQEVLLDRGTGSGPGGIASLAGISAGMLVAGADVMTTTMGFTGSQEARDDGLAADKAIKFIGKQTPTLNIFASMIAKEATLLIREQATPIGQAKVKRIEQYYNREKGGTLQGFFDTIVN